MKCSPLCGICRLNGFGGKREASHSRWPGCLSEWTVVHGNGRRQKKAQEGRRKKQ